jgi:hypothetical protein
VRIKKSKLAREANLRMGRSLNLIRFICEHQYFKGQKMIASIEETLKPIL